MSFVTVKNYAVFAIFIVALSFVSIKDLDIEQL